MARKDVKSHKTKFCVLPAVKEGALRPDISSKEKFHDAMLAVRSVVHATLGKIPSGTHMTIILVFHHSAAELPFMGYCLLIWLRFVILIPHGSRTTVANFDRAWRQRMCFQSQCPCTDNRVDV